MFAAPSAITRPGRTGASAPKTMPGRKCPTTSRPAPGAGGWALTRQAGRAGVFPGPLGVDVAEHLVRLAHGGGGDLHQLLVRPPGVVPLGDRHEEALLVERARVGAEAAPADVDRVAGRAEEGHQPR